MSIEDRYVWYEGNVWIVEGMHNEGDGPKVSLTNLQDHSLGKVVPESKTRPVDEETHKATEWWLQKLASERSAKT